MKISQTGIDLIKHFEGLRLQSYQDIAGIWTIGYGHTGKEVGPNQTITEAEAEGLLRKDLSRFESGVDSAVKIDIDQNMFDALVSLSYNIGVTAFKKSTAVRLLNKGDLLGAAEAITWWNKATINGVKTEVLGLVRRRAAEAALFLQNMTRGNLRIEEGEPEDATRMQPEENNPRRNNPITTRTTGGATVAGAAGAAGAGSAMQHGDEEEAEKEADAPQTNGDSSPIDTPVEPEAEPELESDAPVPGIDCLETDSDVAEAIEIDPLDAEAIEDDAIILPPCPAVVEEAATPPLEETTTQIEASPPVDAPTEKDYHEAFQVVCGVIVVFAVLYIIAARIDDWRKYRR